MTGLWYTLIIKERYTLQRGEKTMKVYIVIANGVEMVTTNEEKARKFAEERTRDFYMGGSNRRAYVEEREVED